MVSVAAVRAGKAKAAKAKAASAKSASSKVEAKPIASHPPWKDMIKECIADHKEETRTGVSRATIKKYIGEKYKLDIEGANASLLNRAIAHGVEAGIFVYPKGPSGKIKLAPKNKPTPTNENIQPTIVKKAPASKPALPVKKPAKSTMSKPASAKPAAAKSATAKSATASAKKTKAKLSPVKKTASAKAVAKKPAAKAAAAAKSKSASKSSKARSRSKKQPVV